jgi:hypothetical protein
MTSDSVDDICLKKEGALCVIYVAKDAVEAKRNEQLSELYATGQKFASKISRGINFYFMYLDAAAEPAFAAMFDLKPENSLPRLVILNPGKRKRYLVHEGGINEADITKTLDKILGGDAKFINIKGNNLATLVTKYPTNEPTK